MPSSPTSRFHPGLFQKGSEALGGSGKALLSRLSNIAQSPKRAFTPKAATKATAACDGAVPACESGEASSASAFFLNAAVAIAAAAALEPARVASFGFVKPLVELVRPGAASEACAIGAMRALGSLATHREHHDQLREAGALPVLMAVLTSPSSSPGLLLAALEVLRPLSRDANAKEMLRDAGAFRPLLSLLAPPDSSAEGIDPTRAAARREAAEAAVGVVRNLATSSANQDALRAAGAVRMLVTLCGTSADSATGDENGEGGEGGGEGCEGGELVLSVRAAATAATALSNLAVGNAANRTAIRQAGGIPKLVRMLSRGSEAAAAATEALGNLAVKSKENKDAIRNAGGVLKLTDLFRAVRVPPSGRGHGGGRRAPPPAASAPAAAPPSGVSLHSHGWVSSMPPPPHAPPPRGEHALLPGLPSLSGMAQELADGEASPSSPVRLSDSFEATAERISWALRNLVAANGLNSAIVVNGGVQLKELDALRSPKPDAAPPPEAPKPIALPPGAAGAAIAATRAESAKRASVGAPKSFGDSRRALAAAQPGSAKGGGGTQPPPTLTVTAKAESGKTVAAKLESGKSGGGRFSGRLSGRQSKSGANDDEGGSPRKSFTSAGVGLVNWSRGRAP